MPDIRHRVRIAAPQQRVYQDLTTKDGFARWWTRAEGEEGTGGKLEFFFGEPEPGLIAEVTQQAPAATPCCTALRARRNGSAPT
jgi:uncharacterized protein YndB with AHSA1/START domain